jgi:hypothetical protein
MAIVQQFVTSMLYILTYDKYYEVMTNIFE